jgi:tyrosyl-tRNA synthetase
LREEQGLANAHTLTRLFFHSDLSALTAAGVLAALRHDPRLVRLPRTQLLELPVVRLAREHALVGSGGDARRLVDQGGLYANNARITNASYVIEEGQLVDGRIAVLRAGKDKHIVLVMDED